MSIQKHISIEDHILIKSSISLVFDAITDPVKLSKWWPKSATSELKENGKLNLEWFNGSRITTRYKTFITNKEISFEFGTEFVSFHLSQFENSTLVKVTHANIAQKDCNHIVHIGQSWSFLLTNLKCWMEFDKDLRDSKL